MKSIDEFNLIALEQDGEKVFDLCSFTKKHKWTITSVGAALIGLRPFMNLIETKVVNTAKAIVEFPKETFDNFNRTFELGLKLDGSVLVITCGLIIALSLSKKLESDETFKEQFLSHFGAEIILVTTIAGLIAILF